MSFQILSGGFEVSPEDKPILYNQRAITKQLNDRLIQVGAVWLKSSSKLPFQEDWFKSNRGDTDLQTWIDNPEYLNHNVGFNLQLGWVDVDIDCSDPDYNKCILAAMTYLQIDSRFKFGRKSFGVATHVLVQLGEEEAENYEFLKRFEPKPFKIDGERYHTQIRSYATNIEAKNVAREAKQTVMPGSLYTHKKVPNAYDLSVWYGTDGQIAEKVSHVAATTARRVSFNEIVRAVTFGTFLYLMQDHWVEGSRQTTAQRVSGWLARVVKDSQAMNNHEALASDVFCPVDSDDIAEGLIGFVAEAMGDDEKHMRIRAYRDARDKLERNPDAKIPGWPAMEQMLGGERVIALRTVFLPGSDVSNLTRMAERYLYDENDNTYIDRERFRTNAGYVHEGPELERRHKGDVVRIGGKPREAFRVFESSDMRKRVGIRDMHPNLDPGGIYRISGLGEVLSDDDDDDMSSLSVFNTWRGWPVQSAHTIDNELMGRIVGHLDTVLGLLTRRNPAQIDWIKKWIAFTLKYPGDKQQIAWVVVGDQGVGKSWIGNIFMPALMGYGLWGSASPKVLEGDFNIGPFRDKMFVFIDEAKFHSEQGVDEIKKLIRNVNVPGMVKFEDARNYNIYARLMIASNRYDINVGQANTRDRALFYTLTIDKTTENMTESEFRSWAETLKPFFEEFTQLMKRRDVREHFMRYFMDMEVNRYELESIQHSSSNDEHLVLSNMSWARRIAKAIVEDGRVFEDLDITYPFTMGDLLAKANTTRDELGMRNVPADRVRAELEPMIEPCTMGLRKMFRFKYRIGTLHEEFGKLIGAPLEARYVFGEADYGDNDCDGNKRPPWKGARLGVVASSKF